MKTLKTITTAFLLLCTVSDFAQTKEETLQWLRNHLKTVNVHFKDSILPYTMTKTYTFYNDAFVVKTVKDFYEDTSLNGPPAFGKIWYKDLIAEGGVAFQDKHPVGTQIYTIMAEHVYFIIGREDAPLKYWHTFNEPAGLDLYLPGDKSFSKEVIHRLVLLAKNGGNIEQTQMIKSKALQ